MQKNISLHPTVDNDTVVIVPCYNEENRLDFQRIETFQQSYPNIHLLFVDDGSSDSTLDLLTEFHQQHETVTDILALPQNAGKAEAVRQGLNFAIESGARFVGYIDADLATPLESLFDLRRVGELLPDVDVIFGSRQPGLGHKINRTPLRRFVSFTCAKLARLATGLPIKDTQCGAKLFRNTPSLQTALKEKFETGWLFDVELFLRLSATYTGSLSHFYEHQLVYWEEVPGSKIGTKEIIRSGIVMLSLIIRRFGIKSYYRRAADRNFKGDVLEIRLHGELHIADLEIVQNQARAATHHFIELNFEHVSQFGPSVATALIGLCDFIERDGKTVRLLLPENEQVLLSATRCGLVDLFDCVKLPIREENLLTPSAAEEIIPTAKAG
ncbi:MAG: glycosyltransferase [bacterium]